MQRLRKHVQRRRNGQTALLAKMRPDEALSESGKEADR
jgi:hypothetical protein